MGRDQSSIHSIHFKDGEAFSFCPQTNYIIVELENGKQQNPRPLWSAIITTIRQSGVQCL